MLEFLNHQQASHQEVIKSIETALIANTWSKNTEQRIAIANLKKAMETASHAQASSMIKPKKEWPMAATTSRDRHKANIANFLSKRKN